MNVSPLPAIARPAAPSGPARLHRHALLLVLAILAVVLVRYMGAYAGSSDTSGYLNSARLLAAGRTSVAKRLLPGLDPHTFPSFAFVPLGFLPNPDGVTMTPTYPIGMPLLLAAGSGIFGWQLGPAVVMGAHALAGVWLTYLILRAVGAGGAWAVAGAVVLAASPLYLEFALQAMSDMPALVWVTAAVYLAWRSRQRIWLCPAAGLAFGIAVLIRPSNLLAVFAVVWALGPSPRRLAAWAAGGLPAAVFLGAYNHAAYGHAFASGYVGLGREFRLAVVPATLAHYARWLPVVLSPLVALALGAPLLWRRASGVVSLLAAWIIPFFAFYAANIHTHEVWWYLRFVLPALPAVIAAMLLVGAAAADKMPAALRRWAPLAVATVALGNGIGWTLRFDAQNIGAGERVYPETVAWMDAHLPPGAVVACMQTSGAMQYYTDRAFFRWDFTSPEDFQRIAGACAAAGRPVYAVLFPYEIEYPTEATFARHLSGKWTQVGAVRYVSIWRYDGPNAP